MDFVTIKTFSNFIDAHPFRIFLLSWGVESFVFDENIVTMNGFLSYAVHGIKVKIRNEDLPSLDFLLQEIRTVEEYKGSIYDKLFAATDKTYFRNTFVNKLCRLFCYFLIGIIITLRCEGSTTVITPGDHGKRAHHSRLYF